MFLLYCKINKIKKLRYIQEHLAQAFHGTISGLNENGIFVELKNVFVDGRIGLRDLGNDYYEFIAEKFLIRGKRSKDTFRLGDEVEVQLIRADIRSLEIDFLLLDHGNQKIPKKPKKFPKSEASQNSKPAKKSSTEHGFSQESSIELRQKNMDKLLKNKRKK